MTLVLVIPTRASSATPSREPRRPSRLRIALRVGSFAAALALPLAGCGSSIDGTATPAQGAGPATTSGPTTTAPAEATATTAPAPDPTTRSTPRPGPAIDPGATDPEFGDAYVWLDGMTVAVGPPTPFVPSPTASAEDSEAYLVFDVVLRNDGTRTYDETIRLAVRSGGAEGDRVFDAANDIESSPSEPLLPGGQRTFRVLFGVADPADVAMEVTPGSDYEPILFTTV